MRPDARQHRDDAAGLKTRRFEHILDELEQAFDIHQRLGTVLGGVHFELTGENVTECIGGARGLAEAGLARAYRSQVDPRLNCEQALEMAMRIARRIGRKPAVKALSLARRASGAHLADQEDRAAGDDEAGLAGERGCERRGDCPVRS